MINKTFYQILGVPESANEQQIHRAFKRLEQMLTIQGTESAANRLHRVREAFVTLSDPEKRYRYDQKMTLGQLDTHAEIAHPAGMWFAQLLKPAPLMALVSICALFVYWNLEKTKLQQIQQAPASVAVSNKTEVSAESIAQLAADNQDRQLLAEQYSLQNQRIAGEQALQKLAYENQLAIAEQQLKLQTLENEQNLSIRAREASYKANRDELDLAAKKMDLQAHKTELALQLKEQNEQHAQILRERALQQRDENIKSIRDLQTAKLREYDRNHYGTGGVSVSNPAFDQ
jgi:curved DNA-binding protein CbpA